MVQLPNHLRDFDCETRFGEVFLAVRILVDVFLTLCSVVVGYQHFGGPCYLSEDGTVPSETLVAYHITTQHHNAEDFDLDFDYI